MKQPAHFGVIFGRPYRFLFSAGLLLCMSQVATCDRLLQLAEMGRTDKLWASLIHGLQKRSNIAQRRERLSCAGELAHQASRSGAPFDSVGQWQVPHQAV